MVAQLGKKIKDIQLQAATGEKVSLKDFEGSKIILFFYPKDNTPGCTREACDFRDNLDQFSKDNIIIIGVSPDSVESHVFFAKKYSLPFTLLADPERKLAEEFGVYKKRSIYGIKIWGTERSTFLIDENGLLVREFRNVKAKGHVERLLKELVSR
jgi:thioredoxin-dependent peroxiredoxin